MPATETAAQQDHDQDVPDVRWTPNCWLAVARDYPQIAVTGGTPESATERFRAARSAWRQMAEAE